MQNFNHIKAYILGLFVGGGKIDVNTFVIDLPFKKWGMDVYRMNTIATDILTKISNYFQNSYRISVTYEIANSKWQIRPVGDCDLSVIKCDLNILGLPTGGFLLSNADLSISKTTLKGINTESFLSGIFDARASLTLSHRRFTNDAPVVSIEIPGSTKNFKFVVQLCSWLTDLGSITDQILYNHPNQHSASNPYYRGWKKGFKIRFLAKSFLTTYSFALQAKSIDLSLIERNQKREEQIPCYLRKLRTPTAVSIHDEQNSNDLPVEVNNKVFFHYHHFCAVLKCPHAPVEEIEKLVRHKNKFIDFFPKLAKGRKDDLLQKFKTIKNEFFPYLDIVTQKTKVGIMLQGENVRLFKGIEQGVAYLFSEDLNGKRHVGSMGDILNSFSNEMVILKSFGELNNSPLLIINPVNERAFICSSVASKLNQELIKRKIKVNNLNISLI